MEISNEFDRQLNNLVQKKYPELLGISENDFIALLTPLKKKLPLDLRDLDTATGVLPFVIVVKSGQFTGEDAMSRIEREGKNGSAKMYPHLSKDFLPTGVSIPHGNAYLLVDIERGSEYLNITPHDALIDILKRNRSPLTIDEGIALITHFPEFLMKNNCFSLLASRSEGNKRVPAIWISGEKRPHLGWCWENNPHTWLGSASCKTRLGV